MASPSVATILRDHVSLSTSCIDRLYLTCISTDTCHSCNRAASCASFCAITSASGSLRRPPFAATQRIDLHVQLIGFDDVSVGPPASRITHVAQAARRPAILDSAGASPRLFQRSRRRVDREHQV